jgi:hypothetical protein
MRLPFGLDLKSVIVGVVVAYFVVPWVMGFISARKSAGTAPAV